MSFWLQAELHRVPLTTRRRWSICPNVTIQLLCLATDALRLRNQDQRSYPLHTVKYDLALERI
jgi:hypothetical protein